MTLVLLQGVRIRNRHISGCLEVRNVADKLQDRSSTVLQGSLIKYINGHKRTLRLRTIICISHKLLACVGFEPRTLSDNG